MNIRTTKPVNNKFYIRKANGGYSLCIQGKPTDPTANVLANCVGYACGRFNEIIGEMKYPQLNCNAENFIERAKSIGLAISDKPVLGGIMVWQRGGLGGNDGAGHVAIVERIDNNNQIYTSESNYGGSAFYNVTRTNNNGRWGMGSAYRFRGCIINPSVKEEKTYTMYVKVNSTLNVRSGAGTNYSIVGSLKNGDKVTVYETRGNWSRIGTNRWVCSTYLVSNVIENTVGQYRTFKVHTTLYANSNLTGKTYSYLPETKVQILENVSPTVDKIKVVKTGRIAYVKTSAYK